MAYSRSFLLFTTLLLAFSAMTNAFPWPRFLPDLDSLVVRQNNNAGSSSVASATGSNTAQPTNTASGSATGSRSASVTASGSGTASGSQTASGSKAGSVTATSARQKTSYDARIAAGAVTMVSPAVASGAQFYKVGDQVTFAWNYTNVLASPTAINVLASCSVNNQLYTIASNMSADATQVIWDTGSYQATAAIPFPVASYTLIIFDAASAMTAPPQPGYLGTYNSYTFGMYTPQPYTPLNEFTCVTCSGALSSMEKNALGFVFAMGAVSVLSATWFIGGLNVIW